MATSFDVIYLGVADDIDTTEGNFVAENQSALEGLTFGSAADPLSGRIKTFAPGTGGFENSGNTLAYDHNNASGYENFTIDGGPDQQFDMMMVYNATLTYSDATTATITAVIFQDTAGNTYLAPETTFNADQAALEAKAIESITLAAAIPFEGSEGYGLQGDRYAGTFVCFVAGTLIETPRGFAAVETLQPGAPLRLYDGSEKPIRWVGTRVVPAIGRNAPILISSGALGTGLPYRDLRVSRQHRVLVRSKIARRMFGCNEVLVPAIRLVGLPGVRIDPVLGPVRYAHFLLDSHELVMAEGVPAESLYPGKETLRSLPAASRREVLDLISKLPFPTETTWPLARPVPAN